MFTWPIYNTFKTITFFHLLEHYNTTQMNHKAKLSNTFHTLSDPSIKQQNNIDT